jgi:hypothetical protein
MGEQESSLAIALNGLMNPKPMVLIEILGDVAVTISI